jgi:hypothetical protein
MHGELRIVASFPGREDIVVSLGELERDDTDDETEPESATTR